jgi:hypothetical protein
MPRRLKGMPYRGKSASRLALKSALERARRKATTANTEVRRLEKLWNSQRPWYHCQRCGHDWQGVNPDRPPQCCAQCHSKGWQRASESRRARKPTDPPNANWGQPNRRDRTKAMRTVDAVPESPPVVVEVEALMGQVERELTAQLRRVFDTPAGLPPPPSLLVQPPFTLAPIPEPVTQMLPPPVLYRPRLQQEIEPQPESFSRPALPPPPAPESVATAPDEPDWEALLPKLPLETVLMADAAEEAWEAYAE